MLLNIIYATLRLTCAVLVILIPNILIVSNSSPLSLAQESVFNQNVTLRPVNHNISKQGILTAFYHNLLLRSFTMSASYYWFSSFSRYNSVSSPISSLKLTYLDSALSMFAKTNRHLCDFKCNVFKSFSVSSYLEYWNLLYNWIPLSFSFTRLYRKLDNH